MTATLEQHIALRVGDSHEMSIMTAALASIRPWLIGTAAHPVSATKWRDWQDQGGRKRVTILRDGQFARLGPALEHLQVSYTEMSTSGATALATVPVPLGVTLPSSAAVQTRRTLTNCQMQMPTVPSVTISVLAELDTVTASVAAADAIWRWADCTPTAQLLEWVGTGYPTKLEFVTLQDLTQVTLSPARTHPVFERSSTAPNLVASAMAGPR